MEVSYLDLFLTFLKIGILLFGGGYGGIGVMYSILVDSKRWISEEEFLRLLAIAESTPGPIALNSATWIGYRLGGIPGSLIATTAIALPPYLVILGIVYLIGPYLEHWIAKAIFRGVNAAIVALILYAFIRLLRSTVIKEGFVDPVALVAFIVALILLYLRLDPVYVIVGAALVGLALSLVI